MSWDYRPYVSVAERKYLAAREIKARQKKGETIEPVAAATPRGKIAASFWGHSWCEHLESYSDYSNRLPRGRTYLRNGSVLHLGIERGRISALVMGSELYRQEVTIQPLPAARWKAIKQRCHGHIGSLVELLQGRISSEIMAIVTNRTDGLFPSPKEINLDCSCPDWADLCKHLAAVLYGVGARLDDAPELLFKLRGVDHNELIQTDTSAISGAATGKSRRRTLAPAALGDVFGIDLDADADADAEPPPSPRPRQTKTKQAQAKTKTKTKTAAKKRAAKKAGRTEAATAARTRPVRRPARPGRVAKASTETAGKPVSRTNTGTAAKAAPPPRSRSRKPSASVEQPRSKTASVAARPSGPASKPFRPTAAAVRRLRKNLGLSRNAFALRLGVSAPSVANWEQRSGPLNLHARSLKKLRDLHARAGDGA